VNNTRAYLDAPANKDVNVIIWSWCGQVSTYTQQRMIEAGDPFRHGDRTGFGVRIH